MPQRFPSSATVYNSLGEAHEKNGEISLARKHYEKAVRQAIKLGDPDLNIYRESLNRLPARGSQ